MPAAVSSPLRAVLFWNIVISCCVGTKQPIFWASALGGTEETFCTITKQQDVIVRMLRNKLQGGTDLVLRRNRTFLTAPSATMALRCQCQPLSAVLCMHWAGGFYQLSSARERKEQSGLSRSNKSTMTEERTRLLMSSSRLSFPSSAQLGPAAVWLTSTTELCRYNSKNAPPVWGDVELCKRKNVCSFRQAKRILHTIVDFKKNRTLTVPLASTSWKWL